MSEYTILDPELTLGMPSQLTLMTGLDVISHATEAYTSILSNPTTDIICEKVIETVVEYLPLVLKDGNDINAREKMQIAASLGGWMLYNACAHVGHSMAHVLGAKYHIAHGAACTYAYAPMIRFISSEVPEKVKKIGEILGVEFTGAENSNEIGDKTATAYNTFTKTLGFQDIENYHIESFTLNDLAKLVANETFAGLSPVKVSEEAARIMLTEVLCSN